MDAATIVKRIRSLSGITRKELAELADLSPSTIGRIERGELDPTWGKLTQILNSTGYQINGDTIVSAGDTTAVVAAKPVLDRVFASLWKGLIPSGSVSIPSSLATALQVNTTSLQETVAKIMRDIAPFDFTKITRQSTIGIDPLKSANFTPSLDTSSSQEWLRRWSRAGWLNDPLNMEDLIAVATTAGNAAKVVRRDVDQRSVSAPQGWRKLALQLSAADVDYAVSGLVAARADRASAESNRPIFYVIDPDEVADQFQLEPAGTGNGVLLLEATNNELESVEIEAGIRFVPRSQAVLDGLGGSGREPEKAENELRRMIGSSA